MTRGTSDKDKSNSFSFGERSNNDHKDKRFSQKTFSAFLEQQCQAEVLHKAHQA